MSSPTKDAEVSFKEAAHLFDIVSINKSPSMEKNAIDAHRAMCYGLRNLSIGVRATYQLLEEVQKELRLLSQSRHS